ncbi:MAG: PD-(D/E)XK nuclease family protein, partial [Firmicutes bacterium]|nr:PD-(D/E)XK nuclease family protein [Bacillota bacterium]
GIVVVDGERWLLEYKTSGESKDQFARNYSGNRQISLYTEALGVRGAILRYIGKTKKEPKRRGGEIVESLPEYGARLLEEYLHAEDKFAEFFVVPTDAQRAEFREQVWNAAQVMLFERRGGIVRKNYCECADCEFHAVCHNETGWESQFYQSDIAHDELPGLLRQNTAAHA